MLSEQNKVILIKVSILAGAFIVTCAILITMIFLAKGFWKNGLRVSVGQTLERYSENTYKTGDFVELKSQFSPGAAVFNCKKNNDSNRYYAVIMRISTISGPAPAVFLCSEYDAEFAGFAVENGNLKQTMNPDFQEIHIRYWKSLLPKILQKAGLFDD